MPTPIDCNCIFYPGAYVDVLHVPTDTLYRRTYIHGAGGIARPAASAVRLAENRAEHGTPFRPGHAGHIDTITVYTTHLAEDTERETFQASDCQVKVHSPAPAV